MFVIYMNRLTEKGRRDGCPYESEVKRTVAELRQKLSADPTVTRVLTPKQPVPRPNEIKVVQKMAEKPAISAPVAQVKVQEARHPRPNGLTTVRETTLDYDEILRTAKERTKIAAEAGNEKA